MSREPKEIVIETDVLVIGGGMAGIFAAAKAREEGVSVTLADKGFVGRSGASSANDGHMTVFSSDWGHDLEVWKAQTGEIGEYMNNPEWTATTCEESYDRFKDIMAWGVEPPTVNGDYVHPFRGVRDTKEAGIDAIWLGWGYNTIKILRKHILEIGVKISDRVVITDLLTQDGTVVGAVGFHTVTGDFFVFKAKAVIIATGTSGFKGQAPACFHRSSFDGESIAYRAGASVSGKEFAMMGRLRPYVGQWPEDAKITPLEGRQIDDIYFRQAPFLWGQPTPIALMGNLVDSEGHGRGPFHPYSLMAIHEGKGPLLHDLESVTPEEVEHACRLYDPQFERFAEVGADPLRRGLYSGVFNLAELFLGRHMGGGGGITSTGLDCGTTLPGLYGAGDSYHSAASGAVYPSGGTGLRVASTTGARAGKSAAKFATQLKNYSVDENQIEKLKNVTFAPLNRTGGFDPDWVGEQIRNLVMPYYVLGVRHGDRLKAALSLVEFLENHIVPMMNARDPHGLTHAHEAKNRILNARMMLESALFRTESRGLHYREDYPRRDDDNWFAHIEIKEVDGRMTLSKMPIDKWWPDIKSKPYLEKYPNRYRGEF